MLSQTVTSEYLLFRHVLNSEAELAKLEKECFQFVINLMVTQPDKKSNTTGWDKDCEFVFTDFVRKDVYWSNRDEDTQRRFILMLVTKVAIRVELYFESKLN